MSGFLEVGTSGAGAVVINHKDVMIDRDGVGHIVFTPEQASTLARLIFEHSAQARRELRKINRATGGRRRDG